MHRLVSEFPVSRLNLNGRTFIVNARVHVIMYVHKAAMFVCRYQEVGAVFVCGYHAVGTVVLMYFMYFFCDS